MIKVGKPQGGYLPVPQEVGDWLIAPHLEDGKEECTGLFRRSNEGQPLLWMSDSDPVNSRWFNSFLSQAQGDIVITGLGIGWLAARLVLGKRCSRLRIVENSVEVEGMVWPYLKDWAKDNNPDCLVELLHADAYEWIPDYCDFASIDHERLPLESEQRMIIQRNYEGHCGNLSFWDYC